jgi:phosphatidylinositol glycan class N
LDTWVFDKFTLLLEQAKTDKALYKKLHSDKIVFFLHLLGLDTNGHSHLPTSEFYLNNIRIVDDGIKKLTEQLSEFYGNDGKTSYVFTADHGMGNRGNKQQALVGDDGNTGTSSVLAKCLCPPGGTVPE